MKPIILKSIGLALWLIVLQVPFTFLVLTPLIARNPEFWEMFNWEILSGGFRTFTINLLHYSLQFVFIFVVTAAYLGLCRLVARKREG
jgi:hypothetical protein